MGRLASDLQKLTKQRPVLIPLAIDAVDLKDPSSLAKLVNVEPRGEGDAIEDKGNGEKVSREDERMVEAGGDEAEHDGEDKRDGLRASEVSGRVYEEKKESSPREEGRSSQSSA